MLFVFFTAIPEVGLKEIFAFSLALPVATSWALLLPFALTVSFSFLRETKRLLGSGRDGLGATSSQCGRRDLNPHDLSITRT